MTTRPNSGVNQMEPKPQTSSSKRQLRRSRTITCNVYPIPGQVQDNSSEEKTESVDQKSPPKSSCQALRHAVSALTRLDDFILEKIGAGFFSEVFKVTHRITGQVLALKMNTMSSNRHNMLLEVQLLNRLNHSNILRFMGVCVHEGQLHALTEYIEEGSLEQLLANKEEELPWIQRIQITLGLVRGLDYLHSRGYIHRDLTSKNILIKRDDTLGYTAVIADFGLATKIPDPLSKEKLPTVGSPYWMAPEVLNGYFYNEKADLFSVGIIMCEITARISADPDIMPRMNNFGVDYVALSEMIEYCPLDYLQLAFKCCQVEPQKRPLGREIIEWLEKIFRNLQNDIFTRQQKEKKAERNGHKRSRSEDNILQANDSEADTSNDDIIITPLLIGQVMSLDDPCYVPSSTNPFASIQRFQTGRKLLGTSIDFAAEIPSPGSLYSPPSTPFFGGKSGKDGLDGLHVRRCQSLPSSPVLLRRAAERNHLESLHGSARYCNLQQIKVVPKGRARSKSTVFPEVLAHHLRSVLEMRRQPNESLSSSHIPELRLEGEDSTDHNSNNAKASVSVNSCSNEPNLPLPPPIVMPTATRRRLLRRLKYQSLDGDAMGVPQIQPLHIASGSNRRVVINGAPMESRASPSKNIVVNSVSAKRRDSPARSVVCMNGDVGKDKPGCPVGIATNTVPGPPITDSKSLKPPVGGGMKSNRGQNGTPQVHCSFSQGQGDHRRLENGSSVKNVGNGVKKQNGSSLNSAKENALPVAANNTSKYRETQL